MKLLVLTDNNTFIDNYYYGEPALSFYIEEADHKILFDTGYSDVFIKNAQKLNIDLSSISTIVFSHGHNDHTGGFRFLLDKTDLSETVLIAHPDVFKERYEEGRSIGSPLSEQEIKDKCRLTLSKEPVKITERITFLGEIPETLSFEKRKSIGEINDGNTGYKEDRIMDDSALVYQSNLGLFIITGCSHSGICNIIEHARKVCGQNKVIGVIGGFHLFGVSEQLKHTIRYFEEQEIKMLYPCHCVSFTAKAEIHKHIPIREIGVGFRINLD